jgi:hypothetical protein
MVRWGFARGVPREAGGSGREGITLSRDIHVYVLESGELRTTQRCSGGYLVEGGSVRMLSLSVAALSVALGKCEYLGKL